MIDGDPDTGWRTFDYKQQFPALKPGVGHHDLVRVAGAAGQPGDRLAEPRHRGRDPLRALAGRRRSADTQVLARATLDDGVTTVSLTNSQPVQYVLVWITHLGGGGSDNSTEIREVSFRRVAD